MLEAGPGCRRGKQQQPAAELVALDTVKKHVSHLLGKLGAANRTEAASAAPPCPRPGSATLSCRGALRKLPPACPPSGDASHGASSYCRRERSQTRPGPPCYRAWTRRLAEEMTVKQIRFHRPMARREGSWRETLPPDPRDPDVVRAKALASSGNPRRQIKDRAVPVAPPAET